ncbi:hypothetical protein BDR26DRAFT_917764 [Obelidium mucronatum]|nr:hypothetical protein BDR26DRAFT_917764 [Obelidium mucronatum]
MSSKPPLIKNSNSGKPQQSAIRSTMSSAFTSSFPGPDRYRTPNNSSASATATERMTRATTGTMRTDSQELIVAKLVDFAEELATRTWELMANGELSDGMALRAQIDKGPEFPDFVRVERGRTHSEFMKKHEEEDENDGDNENDNNNDDDVVFSNTILHDDGSNNPMQQPSGSIPSSAASSQTRRTSKAQHLLLLQESSSGLHKSKPSMRSLVNNSNHNNNNNNNNYHSDGQVSSSMNRRGSMAGGGGGGGGASRTQSIIRSHPKGLSSRGTSVMLQQNSNHSRKPSDIHASSGIEPPGSRELLGGGGGVGGGSALGSMMTSNGGNGFGKGRENSSKGVSFSPQQGERRATLTTLGGGGSMNSSASRAAAEAKAKAAKKARRETARLLDMQEKQEREKELMSIYQLLEEKRREYHESVITETLDKAAKSKARRLELDAKHIEAVRHAEQQKENARQELHDKLKQRANKYTLHKRHDTSKESNSSTKEKHLNHQNFKQYPTRTSQDLLQTSRTRRLSFQGAANVVTAVCALSRRGSSYLQPVGGGDNSGVPTASVHESTSSPIVSSRRGSTISVAVYSRQGSAIGRPDGLWKAVDKLVASQSDVKKPTSPLKEITISTKPMVMADDSAAAAAAAAAAALLKPNTKAVKRRKPLKLKQAPQLPRKLQPAETDGLRNPQKRRSVFAQKPPSAALPALESLEREITTLDQSTVFWDKSLRPPVNVKWEKHHEKYAMMADAVLRRKHTTHKLLNLTRANHHHNHHNHNQNMTDGEDVASIRSKSVAGGAEGTTTVPEKSCGDPFTKLRNESLFSLGSTPSSAGGGGGCVGGGGGDVKRNGSIVQQAIDVNNPLVEIKMIPSIVEELAVTPVRAKRPPNPPTPSRNSSFIQPHHHPHPDEQRYQSRNPSLVPEGLQQVKEVVAASQNHTRKESISGPLPTRTESIMALSDHHNNKTKSSVTVSTSIIQRSRSGSHTMATVLAATGAVAETGGEANLPPKTKMPGEKSFVDVADAVIDGRYEESEKDLFQLRAKIVSASRRASIRTPTLRKEPASDLVATTVGNLNQKQAPVQQHQRQNSHTSSTGSLSRPGSVAANRLLDILRKSPSLKDMSAKSGGNRQISQATSPLQASFTVLSRVENNEQQLVDGVPLPAESIEFVGEEKDEKSVVGKAKKRQYIPLKMDDLFKTELEEAPFSEDRSVVEFEPLPPPPLVREGHLHRVTKWHNTIFY